MTDLKTMRIRLLELHKALIDAERVGYQIQHGRVSANEFLQALTTDPSLTWISPLNGAIVRLDELLDVPPGPDSDPAQLSDHLSYLRALLSLDGRADPFATRYGQLVESSPDVAYAHGVLWSSLRT